MFWRKSAARQSFLEQAAEIIKKVASNVPASRIQNNESSYSLCDDRAVSSSAILWRFLLRELPRHEEHRSTNQSSALDEHASVNNHFK